MSGLLTTAIASIKTTEDKLQYLPPLSPDIEEIKVESLSDVNQVVNDITKAQVLIQGFIKQTVPKINELEQITSQKNASISLVKNNIISLVNQSNELKQQMNKLTTGIESLSGKVPSFIGKLSGFEVELNEQMSVLQSKVNEKKEIESIDRKKYYYLLALGPCGLIGLAIALGIYFETKKQVNDLECEVSVLNSKIQSFNALKAISNLMVEDLKNVNLKFSRATNLVDFLLGDINNFIVDLNENSPLFVINMMLKAAEMEINSIAIDVS